MPGAVDYLIRMMYQRPWGATPIPGMEGEPVMLDRGRTRIEPDALSEGRRMAALAMQRVGLDKAAEEEAKSQVLAQALREGMLRSNPETGSFLLDVFQPNRLVFTNRNDLAMAVPNTVTVNAHGGQTKQGFSPDKLAKIPEKVQKAIAAMASGKIGLKEVARAIGSQTNDVKRVVIASCFNAGYTPEDVKKFFPNVETIIGSPPDIPIMAISADRIFYPPGGSNEWEKDALNRIAPQMIDYTRTNAPVASSVDWIPAAQKTQAP